MGSINGTPLGDSLDGGDGPDTFFLQDGGDDRVRGGAGNDGFYFGAALTDADSVDGGDGTDTLALQGDYAAGLVLGMRNVEVTLFLSGSDTRFGDAGGHLYSYRVATADDDLAAGQTLTVQSTGLLAGENLTFDGSSETDGHFRMFAGLGIDHLTGGAGNDGFFFGSGPDGTMAGRNLTSVDRIDGGAGIDTLALRGDYARWGPTILRDPTFVNIEVLALLSGHSNEFGGALAPGGFRYWLNAADGNVAAGQRLDVNAAALRSDEYLYFDGHTESDGSFRILSGAGNDQLTGGSGADIIYGGGGGDEMTGGAGADIYAYRSLSDSVVGKVDTIWELGAGDKIDLSALDAIAATPGREAFTFVGGAEFSGAAGELRAYMKPGNGFWWVEADVDGDKAADLQIAVMQESGRAVGQLGLVTGDFILTAPSLATPVLVEQEGNDTLATAQAINRGNLVVAANPELENDALPSLTIHGSIAAGDVDYFTISLWHREKLVLDVDGATGDLDTLVTIYGPDGQEIGANDDPMGFDAGSSPGPYDHNTDSLLSFRPAQAGVYTFAIRAFDDGSSGNYDLHVSIAPPPTAAEQQEEDIQALISGLQWDHKDLTYGFPSSPLAYADYGEDGEQQNNFHPLNGEQQAATRSTLASLAALTGLTFTEATAKPGEGELRYAMSDDPDTAYAYLPFDEPRGGDAWFRYSDGEYSAPRPGNYGYLAFIHETGHALGLVHGHEFPALSKAHDSMEYSVMTYRSYVGADIDGYRNEEFGFAQSYMMYDIAALQRLYGANFATQAGDTVYRWSPSTGEMSINGVGQGAPGANRIFMTVWDGGGTDTYDFSNYGANEGTTGGVIVDLRPGEWTRTNQVQLANLGGQFARGNIANALLHEGDPSSLIENAIGGSGNDVLIANQAANHLTGGAGHDVFRWMAASDSPVGAADIVTDFEPGIDGIDLMWIDADTSTTADDEFYWLGDKAFGGGGRELRGEIVDGSVHIFGDVNADLVPDFEIVLANVHDLAQVPWAV